MVDTRPILNDFLTTAPKVQEEPTVPRKQRSPLTRRKCDILYVLLCLAIFLFTFPIFVKQLDRELGSTLCSDAMSQLSSSGEKALVGFRVVDLYAPESAVFRNILRLVGFVLCPLSCVVAFLIIQGAARQVCFVFGLLNVFIFLLGPGKVSRIHNDAALAIAMAALFLFVMRFGFADMRKRSSIFYSILCTVLSIGMLYVLMALYDTASQTDKRLPPTEKIFASVSAACAPAVAYAREGLAEAVVFVRENVKNLGKQLSQLFAK